MFFGWHSSEKKVSDAETFEQLAVPLLVPLYNFARWQTRDHHEAEELVQETFARALKNFSSFQPGTNFRAWMYRILRNLFLNSRTAPAKYVSIDDDEAAFVPTERDTPESILMRASAGRGIQAALERLPHQYREVILMCDVEEMKYQEIAETLAIPIGTVMSRLGRGRRMMRSLLSNDEVVKGKVKA